LGKWVKTGHLEQIYFALKEAISVSSVCLGRVEPVDVGRAFFRFRVLDRTMRQV
jgi:hypothetical protein